MEIKKTLRLCLFLSLFMIPTLLFSLNEKECNVYYKIAIDAIKEADRHLDQINQKPTITKIYQIDLAIKCYQKAIGYFDTVITDINTTKPKKIKPWHEAIKKDCLQYKDICLKSLGYLQKSVLTLHVILSSEQKQAQANQFIDFANKKSEEGQSYTGQQKIDCLREIESYLNTAVYYFQQILSDIAAIAEQEIRLNLLSLESNARSSMMNLQASIADLSRTIHQLTLSENYRNISNFFDAGELKLKQATALQNEIHASTLKEIPDALKNFNDISKLYEEALSNYQKALELLMPYFDAANQQFIKNRIVSVEQLIAIHKTQIMAYSPDEHVRALENQMIALEAMDESLAVKRAIEGILTELADFGKDYKKNLDLVRHQISALQALKIENPTKFATDEEFLKSEKTRIDEFFKRNVFGNEIPCPQVIPHINSDSGLSSVPLVASMHAHGNKNNFVLFQEQFYHFFLQNQTPLDSLTVDVLSNSIVIHTEQIPLPKSSQFDWGEFISREGMVKTPETTLQKQFGLKLQLIAVPGINGNHAFIIKHRADSLDYQFAFSCENHLLYQCSFIAPPPSQLEVLRKPEIPTASKPFQKLFPDLSYLNELHLDASTVAYSYQLLDSFVEEMKNDPLALAQYVQNEIEFANPFLEREKGIFYAPKLQRNTLATFLEKQGSPWEQCALLVYLLRKAGYQAVYGKDVTFSLPTNYVEKLLAVQLPGETETFLEYPCVYFFDGNQWISLFPWMKDIKFQEGCDPYDFLPDEYASAERWIKQYLTNDPAIMKHIGSDGDDTAGVLFVRFVEEYLRKQGLSLQDVGIHRSINKKQSGFDHGNRV